MIAPVARCAFIFSCHVVPAVMSASKALYTCTFQLLFVCVCVRVISVCDGLVYRAYDV